MRTYNLFISHSWSYSENYEKLKKLLGERTYFNFRDYSVPKDDPIHTNGTDKQLHDAIFQKMQPCSVILILAGVYSTYSKSIRNEIWIARRKFSIPKPIVAIEPWGSEKTSQIVKNHADKIVRWNSDSIVEAIREVT